ncbi:CA [Mytilus coruscus]|uniref:Carbonic anhydrase n=1 Tax=Mytilus coruscus TaxID=42192 RepID=A0A6J8DC39_MYTCO|nr:CA [Mytilus coruscus]
MKFIAAVTSFIFLIGSDFASGAVHTWGYHHGVHPEHWKDLYPTCGGKQQSPIDIKTSKVKTDRKLGKFDFSKLSSAQNVKLEITNNGHTVQVGLKGHGLEVCGGGLPGTYVVEQFYFHWGSEDKRGSEHEINGKHFSMEMHVVMHSDRFSSVNESMNSTNGLAVLGFLFDVGRHNHKFDEIINHLHDIQHKDDHVVLKSFSLTSLFPSTNCFYRYYGSLTTPPCYESVIWSIFKQHIYISEYQLNQFRHLGRTHFNGTGDLINNYRNPQPLNHRVVTSNCRQSSTCSCGKKSKTRRSKKSKSRSGKKSKSRSGKKSRSRRSKKSKSRSGKKSRSRSSKKSKSRSGKNSKSRSDIGSKTRSGIWSNTRSGIWLKIRRGDNDSDDR